MKFFAILSAVVASVSAATVVPRTGTPMTQAAAQSKVGSQYTALSGISQSVAPARGGWYLRILERRMHNQIKLQVHIL